MERIQLYPSKELKDAMEKELEGRKCSLSQLAIDILMDHYGLVKEDEKKPIEEIIPDILDEIDEYLRKNPSGTEFDLLTASKTFNEIHMKAEGKPSSNRARVGRVFSDAVKFGRYPEVEQVLDTEGKVKRGTINHAILYRIKEQ